MHRIENLHVITKAAKKANLILIGGQAINTWSTVFHDDELNPWKTLHPYTSEDIDFFGERNVLDSFIEALKENGATVEVFLPTKKEEYALNIAALRVKFDKEEIEINLMPAVTQLNSQEIMETALLTSEETPLALHPLLCVESKLVSLLTMYQGTRQDEKHLRLAIANMNSYFSNEFKSSRNLKILESFTDRIFDAATSSMGITAYSKYRIDLFAAVPIKLIEEKQITSILEKYNFHKANRDKVAKSAEELEAWMAKERPHPLKEFKLPGASSLYPNLPSEPGI